MSDISQHSETLALHAGSHRRDSDHQFSCSADLPNYKLSNLIILNMQASFFALQELGNIYTRIMNPTTQVLEERLAAIRGWRGGTCPLVQAATAVALSIREMLPLRGDNIVASPHLYGGTYNLFTNTLRQMGIEVRFADPFEPSKLC